jgi:hypothetical protein
MRFRRFVCAVLLLAYPASASAPYDLAERLEHAARGLPCPKEPQQDARALARAIAAASGGDRTLAAAMLTTAWAETALADRLRRNECRPRECDSRRAWGSFQRHNNGNNAAVWGSVDIDVQATDAARAMRSAFYTAKAAHAPFPAGMFRIYAGRRPDVVIPREALRVSTFEAVRRQL